MKKSFIGLVGNKTSLLMAGALAAIGFGKGKRESSFDQPESNPIKRSNKSGGGSRSKRDSTRANRYRAWKKLFGGLAVPEYWELT